MRRNASTRKDNGKPVNPTRLNAPDYLFNCACNFMECASSTAKKDLISEKGKPPSFDSIFHAKLPVPIVNITFSIELALKGLAMQEKKEVPHIHDLLKLFDVLEQGTQDKIIEHYKGHNNYKSLIAIRLGTLNGCENGSPVIVEALSKDRDGILELLRVHANYFEEFRYIFEMGDREEKTVLLRELFNFCFSTLTVLGERIGKVLQYGK